MRLRGLLISALVLVVAAFATFDGRDIVIVIDTSKSMNANGLFGTVQQSLATLAGSLEPGDRVIVYGFDSDVRVIDDRLLAGASDIAELQGRISAMRATGDWTYLTRVIDVAARRIEELQRLDSRRQKLLYVLTDGKNDPPRGPLGTVEAPIPFESIIAWHRGTLTRQGTAFYLVTFGVHLTPEERAPYDSLGAKQTEVIRDDLAPGVVMPLTVLVTPASQALQLQGGAAGQSVEIPLTLRRGPGRSDTVNVSFAPTTLPPWATQTGLWAARLTADSSLVGLHISVNTTTMGAAAQSIHIVARATGASVSPETLTVGLQRMPPASVGWTVTPWAEYDVKVPGTRLVLTYTTISQATDTVHATIEVVDPAGASFSVDTANVVIRPGTGEHRVSLLGPKKGGTFPLRLRLSSGEYVVISPREATVQAKGVGGPLKWWVKLLIVLALVGAITVLASRLRKRFPKGYLVEVLDRGSKMVTGSADLRALQGRGFRRSVVLGPAAQAGLRSYEVFPAGFGVRVKPLDEKGRLASSAADPSDAPFDVNPGQEFEIGSELLRLRAD